MYTNETTRQAIRNACARERRRKSGSNTDVLVRVKARTRLKYANKSTERRREMFTKALQRKLERAQEENTVMCADDLLPVYGN